MIDHFTEILLVYCVSIGLFCTGFIYLRVAATARNTLRIGKRALATIADDSMDDRAKEIATQKAGIEMMRNFVMVTVKGGVVIILSLIPVFIVHLTGIFPVQLVIDFSFRLDTVIATCIVAGGSAYLIKKHRAKVCEGKKQGGLSEQYSKTDRAVHRIAFRSNSLQEMLGDIEAMLFQKCWADVPIHQPLFITSLPRAGTTVLLEAFHHISGFATHTYRDMPFILSPVLWNKFSGRIRKKGKQRQRAHGDGVIVSEDSPEAFEEVIWRKLSPEHFHKNGLILWENEPEIDEKYITAHLQKIISLRCPEGSNSARYVSKNNANISRVDAIKKIFSDAIVLVPLRHPVEQAASLWRQHMNFLEQHSTDRFVKDYMEDIGHYEFGLLHRPIRFPQFEKLTENLNPSTIDYWLAYWVSAFGYLAGKEAVSFICYEDLCRSPRDGLLRLMDYINFQSDPNELTQAASIFRAPDLSRKIVHPTDKGLMFRAQEIYEDLRRCCVLRTDL